jgi:hypothetical protein
MHRLDALLMPEVAATVERARDRARFALYRKLGKEAWLDDPREAARRDADTMGIMAEWALAYSGDGSDAGFLCDTQSILNFHQRLRVGEQSVSEIFNRFP